MSEEIECPKCDGMMRKVIDLWCPNQYLQCRKCGHKEMNLGYGRNRM